MLQVMCLFTNKWCVLVEPMGGYAGIHLIKHTAFRTLERGGQFVLLGSAPDSRVQAEFNTLNNQMRSENAAFCFSYDEPLSHLIYAGCDLIVVPSMFEPCGLTQVCIHPFSSPAVSGVHVASM
jgi:starch synthase